MCVVQLQDGANVAAVVALAGAAPAHRICVGDNGRSVQQGEDVVPRRRKEAAHSAGRSGGGALGHVVRPGVGKLHPASESCIVCEVDILATSAGPRAPTGIVGDDALPPVGGEEQIAPNVGRMGRLGLGHQR